MRIRQIIYPLREAIPNRPRSLNYYVVRLKNLRDIQAAFHQAAALLKTEDYPSDLRYALEDGGIEFDIYEFRSLGNQLENQYSSLSFDNLISAIESFVKFAGQPGHDFFRYIPSALEHINLSLDQHNWRNRLAIFPSYPQAEQAVKNNELLNPEYHDEEEITQVQNFLAVVKILAPAIKKYFLVLDDLTRKVKAQQNHSELTHRIAWNDKNARPGGELETLYHATAYANEVAANGFAAEKPVDRLGVGNFGTQGTISFTHDLKIAMDIMRALKEIALIANGQLKARAIADWIRRENIPNFPWHEFMRVYKGQNEFYSPQYEDTTLDRFDIVQTAKLYEKYIWLSKIHPNPVFVSVGDLVQSLVGRPQSDIGIVACAVALDPNQSTYHPGEAEFRVPPAAVQSIKRIM